MKHSYGDSIHVITVYVIDPHPNGSRSPYNKGNGWQEWWQNYVTSVYPENNPQGYPLFQPRTFKERVGHAKNMMRQRGITTPILIDEMDNPYWTTYGLMPNCAYLIDKTGIVFYRETWFAGGPGDPYNITSMRSAIDLLLGLK